MCLMALFASVLSSVCSYHPSKYKMKKPLCFPMWLFRTLKRSGWLIWRPFTQALLFSFFTSILCMVCILVTAWLKKTTNGAACNRFPSKCDSLDLWSPRFIRLLSVMTTCCHSISRPLCFEKGLIGADEPAGSPSCSSNEKSLSPRFSRYAET